jgi:hypothetical protein
MPLHPAENGDDTVRDARIRFCRIGGALLAIGIVLLAAVHVAGQDRSGAAPSIAEVGMRERPVSVAPGIVPMGVVLDTRDASTAGRNRVVAYAIVPRPATRARIVSELSDMAEAIARSNPDARAIMILGYRSETERQARGDEAPWSLAWARDGSGWDGLGRNDFEKHVLGPDRK